MSSMATIFRKGLQVIRRNGQTILAGVSIVSTVGATILSAKATPKALQLIEEEEYNRQAYLSNKEKVQVAWKCYIPAGILALLSCASTVFGTKMGLTRQAELISLVTAGENMYERYRQKMIKKIGAEGEKEVRAELAKERAEQFIGSYPKEGGMLPAPSSVIAYDTGLGDELIWDAWNGRFLKGSETEFLKQVAMFNKDMSYGIGVFFPVNNFYDLINAPTAMNGTDQGFTTEYMLDVDFRWDSDRHAYKIMTFVNPPKFERVFDSDH